MQLRHLRRLRFKLAAGMSSRFLWHLLRLPSSFYDQRFAGEISNRITLKLDPSTFSGYAWSSATGSPHQKMSSGITTSVRVILEEKAPIAFVLPIQ